MSCIKIKLVTIVSVIIVPNLYLYEKLKNKGVVYLRWCSCRVMKDFGVMRCYNNCSKYGHTAFNCKL